MKYVPGRVPPTPPDTAQNPSLEIQDGEVIYIGYPRPEGVAYSGTSRLELFRAEIDHRFKRGDR